MSLLTIIQSAMVRQGQAAPVTVVGNADAGVIQRIALLQDIGDELAERVTWQSLNTPGTITCDGATTLFALPTGWGGLSEGEVFQSTLYPTVPVPGPVSNEVMAAFKAAPLAPLQPIWRVIGGQIEFYPAPAAGEVYTFNYYSNMWIKSAAGALRTAWIADTDYSLIDEKILISGLEWRWLKAKGLDYSEEFRRFEMRIARAEGRDDDGREVSMSRRLRGWGDTWPGQIPFSGDSFDDGFGSGFF